MSDCSEFDEGRWVDTDEGRFFVVTCPHCHKTKPLEVIAKALDYRAVLCVSSQGGCGAQGGVRPTVEKAVAAWNVGEL